MKRTSLAGTLAAAAVLLIAPTGASAATTLGQTFAPITQCTLNTTHLQTTSPGGSYTVPTAGVITNWSFLAPAPPVPTLKFKVGRPAGGDNFTIVGESPLTASLPGVLNTYPVQIPVQAGDVIGLYSGAGGRCAATPRPGFVFHGLLTDAGPGTTQAYTPGNNVQMDVSATLETTPCKGLAPTMAGTAGDDDLAGTEGPDVIVGLEGNDSIGGLGAKDVICGAAGRDRLRGGPSKDILLGEGGRDRLKGGGGKDTCSGGKGSDSATACETEKSI